MLGNLCCIEWVGVCGERFDGWVLIICGRYWGINCWLWVGLINGLVEKGYMGGWSWGLWDWVWCVGKCW